MSRKRHSFESYRRQEQSYLFLAVDRIVEGCANGGAILRILGDMETDVVELLKGREDFLALG